MKGVIYMASVYDVADFFIDFAKNDENDTITNLRLNKLLFFAQAWHLVKYDTPLFNDNIEAWDLGPVVPVIYQKYKDYNKNNIDSVSSGYSTSNFTSEEIDTLTEVIFFYGRYSTTELVNQTHQENSPWKKVYEKGKNEVINKDSIKEYYSQLIPQSSFFTTPKWMYLDAETPKRNTQGVAIITEDWE